MTAGPLKIEIFNEWLELGERGISSNAIVTRLTGIHVGGGRSPFGTWPSDPSDFRRCELLLRSVPIARDFLHLMSDEGMQWEALVRTWDELVELGESEVPGCFNLGGRASGSAPKLYARMKELTK